MFRLLNKVTSDTFISLSKSLIAINVESPATLEIIVQLIFKKASNESNFTHIYSKLCVILCELARNFEPENTNSTFKTLLLKRCEHEFFRRPCIDHSNPISRQKCIGAIRFIAHLGCNCTITDKILHDCVKALLSSRPTNSRTAEEPSKSESYVNTGYPPEDGAYALDLECLCQFLKIVGRHMDTEKAHNLMDQYFKRMRRILDRASPELLKSGEGKFVPLSTRIRFLLQDTIDLRENNWVPLVDDQNPDTDRRFFLSDLKRELDMASSGESLNNLGPSGLAQENEANHRANGDSFDKDNDWNKLNRMGKALCTRGRDVDLFSGVERSMGVSQRNCENGYNRNNFHNNNTINRRNGFNNYQGAPKRVQTPRLQGPANTYNHTRRDFDTMSNGSSGSSGGNGVWSNRNFSRFCRSPPIIDTPYYPKLPTNSVNYCEQGRMLSSCASSTVATPATPSPDLDAMASGRADVRQLGAVTTSWRPSSSVARPTPPPPTIPNTTYLHPLPSVITYTEKGGPVDENKEIARALLSAIDQTKSGQEIIDLFESKNLFSRVNKEVMSKLMIKFCNEDTGTTDMDEKIKQQICTLVTAFASADDKPLIKESTEASWQRVCLSVNSTTPKTSLAYFVARLVLAGCFSLNRVAEPLSAGRHHPFFFVVLQYLAEITDGDSDLADQDNDKNARRRALVTLFSQSGIVLEKLLPEGSQSPARVLALLKERGIDFFMPTLRLVVEELCPLLVSGDLGEFARRHEEQLLDVDFGVDVVHSLMAAALERVYGTKGTTSQGRGDEAAMLAEESAWRAIVKDGNFIRCVPVDKQLDALHALQVFWHDKGTPKGFLLSCFQNMYNCELVDEPTFLSWKEEVNPNYPAKGQALFEATKWLIWLETAEVEEDSNVL